MTPSHAGAFPSPIREPGRVQGKQQAPHAGRSRTPSLVACGLRILLVKLLLRLLGFDRTWAIVRAHAEPGRHDRPAELLVARASLAPAHEEIEYTVALAAALYPGRALCLERSLVLYHYLRRAGLPIRLRLGVQAYPFAAHAWVEYAGKVLNDVPEHVAHFTPVDAFCGHARARGTS